VKVLVAPVSAARVVRHDPVHANLSCDEAAPRASAFAPPRAQKRRVGGEERSCGSPRSLRPKRLKAGELVEDQRPPARSPADADPAIRRRLRDIYRDDVERLSRLLGRAFPWPEVEANNACVR
jgi:hypothetical protein